MKTISGNLIELTVAGHFDVIVQGCNCWHTMGSGVARAIRSQFPQAYIADLRTAYGDPNKLGTTSEAEVTIAGCRVVIVNAYTQFRFGTDRRHVDYDAVHKCFADVKRKHAGLRIGYPKIGAGLAGGDWEIISAIIDEELAGEDHTLVVLPD